MLRETKKTRPVPRLALMLGYDPFDESDPIAESNMGIHRWNRNPRPQPQNLSKLVFLLVNCFVYIGYLGLLLGSGVPISSVSSWTRPRRACLY